MKIIPLTQGKFTQVSDHQFDYLNQWKWRAFKMHNTWYAARDEGGKTVYMHRCIINAQKGIFVDHVDLDGLNNQDENLRTCTHAENCRNRNKMADNTSGYKGVLKVKDKWVATLRVNSKRVLYKTFSNALDAAHAYDQTALQYFGEFARLNFPD